MKLFPCSLKRSSRSAYRFGPVRVRNATLASLSGPVRQLHQIRPYNARIHKKQDVILIRV